MLLLASAISLLGNQLTSLAIPWLVLTTIGTAWEAGLVGAAMVFPAVVGAVFGGVVVDRLGSRSMSIAADLTSAVAVVAIPLAALTIGLPLALLVALAFMSALLDAPGMTARQVMVPELADRAGVPLERANGLYQSVENATLMVGPVAAGLIIVAIGPVNALWLDGASFVISAAIVALAVPRALRAGEPDAPETADVLAGVRLLGRDAVLRGITLVAAVANFVGTPMFIVLLPAFAIRHAADADVLGLLLGAFGAGLVCGSVGFSVIGSRVPRRRLAVTGFAATGVAIGLVAAAPPIPLVAVALFAAGLASGPINPIAFTVMQERVPAAVRGRVFGAVLGGVLVAAPAGMLVMGGIAEHLGPEVGLAIVAVSFVGVAVVLAGWRGFRELDRRPVTID